jgi:hypothetical protein
MSALDGVNEAQAYSRYIWSDALPHLHPYYDHYKVVTHPHEITTAYVTCTLLYTYVFCGLVDTEIHVSCRYGDRFLERLVRQLQDPLLPIPNRVDALRTVCNTLAGQVRIF